MQKKNIFLIDANSFCYRAFFAIKQLSTSYGQPTNAVYGFVTMLNKILHQFNPDYLAICFDVGKDTFRQRRFKEYKIHRAPMPDSLSSQMPIIEDIIEAYNLAIFAKEGFEADDIIATCVKKARENGLAIYIISGDKDILQLVDKDVFVYNPTKEIIFDNKKVEEHFGVAPNRIKELIALMGDATDNIPGVKGIGAKTAVSLLNEFKELDNLLENSQKVKSEKLRLLLEQSKEIIELSRELAQLKDDIDLDFNLNTLKVNEPNKEKLSEIFKKLEFKTLVKQFSVETNTAQAQKVELKEINSENEAVVLSKKISQVKELFLALREDKLLLTFDGEDKVFSISPDFSCVRDLLCDEKIKKSGHDLKEMKLALARRDINLSGIYFDTMIASYLLNPAKTDYALEECLFEHMNITLPQENKEIYFVSNLANFKKILDKKLKAYGLLDLFVNLEMPLVGLLAEMEFCGISIDKEALSQISQELGKKQEELLKQVFSAAGEEFNLNSPKQLANILFNKLKIVPLKRTKTGFSTNEEVLKRLSSKYEICKIILEYREITKLKSTYADGLLKLCNQETCKLHTSFIQTGTQTGRLSSREPNLQNIPIRTELGRQFRKVFIPSKGCILLSADYSQIELRVLAHLSQDNSLIDAFLQDKDIHNITAALIHNVKPEDVNSQMRATAKTINFGIAYGMSAFGLAQELGISNEEAQVFIDAYFMRYSKVKKFMQNTITEAEKNGFVTTIMGRRRYLEGINSSDLNIKQFAQRQAINTPVQGSAADIIKQAMLFIHSELLKRKLASKIILQIHDELLLDVAASELGFIKEIVRDKMEYACKLLVPLKANIKVGKNWLQMEEVS